MIHQRKPLIVFKICLLLRGVLFVVVLVSASVLFRDQGGTGLDDGKDFGSATNCN